MVYLLFCEIYWVKWQKKKGRFFSAQSFYLIKTSEYDAWCPRRLF